MASFSDAVFPGGGPNSPNIFQFDAVHKKVLQGTSFSIPESTSTVSPSGGSGAKPVQGGILYAITSNDSGTNENADWNPILLEKGQTVAVTVAANKLTVTVDGTTVFTVTGTSLTVGVAQLLYV